MKIILMSVGTRGDMEPFLSLGEIFQKQGHEVICAFPEQFRHLSEESGLGFGSLGSKLIELLESEIGKTAMGGSGSGIKRVGSILKLAMNQKPAQKELIQRQKDIIETEDPDRIVHNAKCVYPIIWAVSHPGKTILVSPVPYLHYVKGHTHVAFNSNYGTWLNRFTFWIAQEGTVITTKVSLKWLKMKGSLSKKQIRNAIRNNKVIYAISPELFPRPNHWNDHMQVLGYWERANRNSWYPSAKLVQFLEKHEKILFISFGSMTNPEPEKKTNIILDILIRHQIPTIINIASGGLIQPNNYPHNLVHFVSRIPYQWLFPKIYGVIHHGGSGTTHLALKYGCASMIIPHIIDQFVWNDIVAQSGAGPKGPKMNGLSIHNLESKLLDLWNNPSYIKQAMIIADQMKKENFEDQIIKMVVSNKI